MEKKSRPSHIDDCFVFLCLIYRYNDSEIETKVEELCCILSEQSGIGSKNNKEGKST